MTTAFLAQFLGLFLLFVSLGVLFNREHAIGVVHDLVDHKASQLLSSLVPVLLGLWVVLTHTQWVGWEIVVTLTGWFLLVVGVFRLWCPGFFGACVKKHGEVVARLGAIVFFVLSLLLLYVGFVV